MPVTGVPTPSVVICCYTLDRWTRLCAAVESVLAQRVSGLVPELVVVVDHHEELFTRLAGRFPDVTVVPNKYEQGLSGARNTGVELTSGGVVLFLDDDATARPGWAEELLSGFGDPAVMAAGGRVEPDWEGGAAPAWFPQELGWVVGCSYTGQPAGRAEVRNPIGASMAVRRELFDAVGGFATTLGRVGALPVGCEETELCIRAAARIPGMKVLLEPSSVVDHAVPAARQQVRYAIRRCYHEGRSKAAVARLADGRGSLGVEAAYASRVLPRAAARHLVRGIRGSRADLVAAATIVVGLGAAALGYLVQGARLRRGTA